MNTREELAKIAGELIPVEINPTYAQNNVSNIKNFIE